MRRSLPGDRSGPLAIALACAVALACGGDVEPDPGTTRTLSSTSSRPNQPPTIDTLRFEPRVPLPGEPVRAVVEVSDPDDDPVKMVYQWSLRGEPVGRSTPKLMLGDARRGDEVAVVALASDGRDESQPARRKTEVGNRPPEVSRLGIRPALEITAGEEIGIEVQGEDPDGDLLEYDYAWQIDGRPTGNAGPKLDTSALQTGNVVTVEVTPDDGTDRGEPFASPAIRVTNEPPRVVSQPRPTAGATGFRYRVVAQDPNGDAPLRFTLEQAPEGMEIEAHTGQVSWRPRPDQAGIHPVRVVVDDQRGGSVAHVFDVDVAGAPPAEAAR